MERMSQWKVGDTVQLKSDGPVMTVTDLKAGSTDDIWCSWFAGTETKKAHFPPEALKAAEP